MLVHICGDACARVAAPIAQTQGCYALHAVVANQSNLLIPTIIHTSFVHISVSAASVECGLGADNVRMRTSDLGECLTCVPGTHAFCLCFHCGHMRERYLRADIAC